MKDFTEKITITGGEYRGRKILTPGGKTHPMGSRERLALFNILSATLGGKIIGALILDAFAGSGALGIEALSRGASKVVFTDSSRRATEVIRKNLASLGAEDRGEVICAKVSDLIERLGGYDSTNDTGDADNANSTDNSDSFGGFDVILADPPYDDFDLTEVEILTKLLEPEGTLILSHPGEVPELGGLELLKTHTYAAAHLSIYSKKSA